MAKKILIIDDDKIFAKILKDGLTQSASKHEVSVAHDGEEGLEKVKQDRPDLIVLDMMMPKIGGIEFLKKIKLFNIAPQIPVIISSQLVDVEKISESVELGIKGYIVKSDFSLENIIKQIESILNKEKVSISSGDPKAGLELDPKDLSKLVNPTYAKISII